MALVEKPRLLRDPCEGLVALAQQTLRPFKPALDDIALWPNPGRLLERAAEVIGARHAMSARMVSERSSSRCAST